MMTFYGTIKSIDELKLDVEKIIDLPNMRWVDDYREEDAYYGSDQEYSIDSYCTARLYSGDTWYTVIDHCVPGNLERDKSFSGWLANLLPKSYEYKVVRRLRKLLPQYLVYGCIEDNYRRPQIWVATPNHYFCLRQTADNSLSWAITMADVYDDINNNNCIGGYRLFTMTDEVESLMSQLVLSRP